MKIAIVFALMYVGAFAQIKIDPVALILKNADCFDIDNIIRSASPFLQALPDVIEEFGKHICWSVSLNRNHLHLLLWSYRKSGLGEDSCESLIAGFDKVVNQIGISLNVIVDVVKSGTTQSCAELAKLLPSIKPASTELNEVISENREYFVIQLILSEIVRVAAIGHDPFPIVLHSTETQAIVGKACDDIKALLPKVLPRGSIISG